MVGRSDRATDDSSVFIICPSGKAEGRGQRAEGKKKVLRYAQQPPQTGFKTPTKS
nr:hypothetical protein [Fischerella sp. PCC 9605]